MAIAGVLMTSATDSIDRETLAIRNFGYAIAYHCTTAALMAVESPDEVGRTVYAALRDEYRQLARFLLTDSQKDMASHYAVKADLVERIKKDTDTPGKVSSGGDEKKVRKALGDVRYFLEFLREYVSSEALRVANLPTRRLLSESVFLIENISNVFRRLDLGDIQWLEPNMEAWMATCSAARGDHAIDL